MPQQSLFDLGPATRATGAYGTPYGAARGLPDGPAPPTVHSHDPASSREADDRHRATGRRDTNLALVLDLVTRHPDATACELWARASAGERDALVELQEIRRRLTDLHHAGLVAQGDPRPCAVKGTRQVTWRAAR